MKYYAIPDLHGRYDILRECVSAIEKHSANEDDTRVITLGDYVDRGPDSKKIIEYLMNRGENWTCLKGNHEDIMLQAVANFRLKEEWWFPNGGMATMISYGGDDPDPEHLAWVKDLPLYYETPKHVFVHAGIPDDRPLEDQNHERLMWMLYGKTDHGGWRDRHVVHGHHIHEDGPLEYNRRTALDTGSFYTNRQVIGVFDDTQGRALEFIEITA